MPPQTAMQVLNILRQSLRKRDKHDRSLSEEVKSPPPPPKPTRVVSSSVSLSKNGSITMSSRASTLRQPPKNAVRMSLSRVSHPPLPSKDDEAQDFTLSLDCAEISAEVRVADILQRSWLKFCLQTDGIPYEGAVLVAAGESAKFTRRQQTEAKRDRRRRRANSLEADGTSVRPPLRHVMSSTSVSYLPTSPSAASMSVIENRSSSRDLASPTPSEFAVTAPLRLKPKRSVPQLEGVWEEFLVETDEDMRSLSPMVFDHPTMSSSKQEALERKVSGRSLKQTLPSSPRPRIPRYSPSAPSLSALTSVSAKVVTERPPSPSGEFLDDLINFYSSAHTPLPGPSSLLRRKSGMRKDRIVSPLSSLQLSASTLQALVPDANRHLDDDTVDPILPKDFSLDQFPIPPDHHRRNPSRTSERSHSPHMASSRTSSVSSITTAVTPTTANFPATPPLSRSSSRSSPASILKKHGKSSPVSSPIPATKQLSSPNLSTLTPEENIHAHFVKDPSRGLTSPTFFHVPVISGDHAELQIMPEPRSPPILRRHMAMPSDASSSEEADVSGDMVFYPQSPRVAPKPQGISRPSFLPSLVPVPKRPTKSKSTILPKSNVPSSSSSSGPRPKSVAPGLWRRKMHSESSAIPQSPSISPPRPLARPRPFTVLSDSGRLQVNSSRKPYFQSFVAGSDVRIPEHQRLVKPGSPIGTVQYGYAF